MRGHDALIAMRRGGQRPRTLQIHAGVDHSLAWKDWQDTMPGHAEVEIADDEFLSGLDLRFVVGMRVIVTGDSDRRVTAIHAKCVELGARRVVSAVFDGATLLKVIDTAEVIQ